MKKSIKISLGGIAFNIEDDAYELLKSYLESLKKHMNGTPEADEIVKDIEERAAELFTEMLQGKEIITIEMVTKIIDTLGSPEQITDEEVVVEDTEESSSSSSTKRRLYRDGDNAIIAGIGAGLGAYFNIDPIIFRILLFVLIFANGLGFVIYFVLWIALPRAETVRQKMEMRGEEINFSNLEKNIKNEFEEVKKSMEKHRVSGLFERLFSALGRVFIALGRALGVVAQIVGVILAVVIISIGLIGLLGTTASFFLGSFIANLLPAYSGLTINEMLATTIDLGSMLWITIPLFFVCAIPFLAILYLGLRMVFKFKARDSVIFVSGATLWILAITMLAFVTFLQARSFTIRESVKERIVLSTLDEPNVPLRIIAGQEYNPDDLFPDRIVTIEDYTIAYTEGNPSIVGKPKVFIGKSNDENFEMVITKKSRGATRQLARNSADRVVYNHSVIDMNLIVNPFYFLPSGDKWRAQDVEITINVPEGGLIFIDRSMEQILSTDQNYSDYWPDEMLGKTWVMRGDRLVER